MTARFSIGIDLGTTNSALAFVALDAEASSRARESGRGDPVPGTAQDARQWIASPAARNDGGGGGFEARSEILQIAQWEAASRLAEAHILPSFLYLPEDGSELAGRESGRGQWVAGRLARAMAGERPGRVAHSAKSWLCHPGADPSAPFLPWGSDEVAPDRKISPVRASALILNALRGAWDSRFAAHGAGFRFDAQVITVTVPASFDASAQRLTLMAAGEAGFPSGVRLLEEPQAAFYAWLEGHDALSDLWRRLPPADGGSHHILVVDIGGGTSDFSLFEIRAVAGSPVPAIRRIAVSDHILLGGDNIDLAIARQLEAQLVEMGGKLSGAQWDFLVARCRDLKERALAGEGDDGANDGGASDDVFPVAIPGRGAGLIAGTLSAQITRADIDAILFDGFYPACPADARPYKPAAALREWGLPFAADSAVTRHLAAFLAGRPRVDAVLFNGGSLAPSRLRARLAEQIGAWQGGAVPLVLDNAQPDLAVARGAARFGALAHSKGARIEAGAAHAVFLALHRAAAEAKGDGGKGNGGKGNGGKGDGGRREAPLVCILPRGAAPEEMHEISEPAMELRVNRPVRFQAYTSTRHEGTAAGAVVAWTARDFRPLPALETLARLEDSRFDETRRRDARRTLPVALTASLNELGLLQVSLVSTDPAIRQSWPLDFNLRPREQGDALSEGGEEARPAEPNVSLPAMEAARQRVQALFAPPSPGKATKITGARVFKDLETALGLPKVDWNWVVLRALWPTLEECMPGRAVSVEHEEAWLILAGFLLRPGFGAAGDEARIDGLWRLHEAGLCFPGKRIRPQVHILWRRVAGGLTRERQEQLFADEIEGIRRRGDATPELIHLLGSLERLGPEAKGELIERFTEAGLARAQAQKHPAPYFTALGLLLNRAPLYSGPETVVPPELVERAYEAFAGLDWRDPANAELATLFLRAARVVDNRSLDVSRSVRQKIAGKLEKANVPTLKVAKVRNFMPMERSERLSLYAEALPPGLLLRDDG